MASVIRASILVIFFLSALNGSCAFIETAARRSVCASRSPPICWSSSSESTQPLAEAEPSTTNVGTSKKRNTQLTARFLAVKAIVAAKGSWPADAVTKLESLPGYVQLSERDRSFARLLVTTTERRLGQIDKVLIACQKEKPRKRTQPVDHFVRATLRIGAVQLLFLGVSAHAAVKETVDVLRLNKKLHVPEQRIKYVNAVLRRLSREGSDLLSETTIADNASEWLVEEWRQTWGDEATDRILVCAMEETPRCLSVNAHPVSVDSQIEYVSSWFPKTEVLPQGSIRVLEPPPGPVSSWPLYQEGAWWLQDVSATLPAKVLYNALSASTSLGDLGAMHVVDMCAAPGGKTAQLCCYGFGSVTAIERSERRSRRLQTNMQRLKLENYDLVVEDATEWIPADDKKASGVLIDVPCTASGTASKRPDVLRRAPDNDELLDLQYRLACHAAENILLPGGILVYATCSLLKSESEDQISKLLQRQDGPKLETVPIEPGESPGFDDSIDENGWLRVLPGQASDSLGQYDGFFVARLKVVE